MVLKPVTHSLNLDLVITDRQGNLHVFQNDGLGVFTDVYQLSNTSINDVQDLNQDGIGDLIVKNGGVIKVFDGACQ